MQIGGVAVAFPFSRYFGTAPGRKVLLQCLVAFFKSDGGKETHIEFLKSDEAKALHTEVAKEVCEEAAKKDLEGHVQRRVRYIQSSQAGE